MAGEIKDGIILYRIAFRGKDTDHAAIPDQLAGVGVILRHDMQGFLYPFDIGHIQHGSHREWRKIIIGAASAVDMEPLSEQETVQVVVEMILLFERKTAGVFIEKEKINVRLGACHARGGAFIFHGQRINGRMEGLYDKPAGIGHDIYDQEYIQEHVQPRERASTLFHHQEYGDQQPQPKRQEKPIRRKEPVWEMPGHPLDERLVKEVKSHDGGSQDGGAADIPEDQPGDGSNQQRSTAIDDDQDKSIHDRDEPEILEDPVQNKKDGKQGNEKRDPFQCFQHIGNRFFGGIRQPAFSLWTIPSGRRQRSSFLFLLSAARSTRARWQ